MGKNRKKDISLSNKKLSFGLELLSYECKKLGEKNQFEYNLDTLYTKNWLSKELGIHRDFIVRGNIDF